MKKEVQKPRHRVLFGLFFIIIILIAYVIWVFQFSYPDLTPRYAIKSFDIDTTEGSLPFPSYGESAVAVGGSNIIQTSGKQVQAPIASVAKLITALCVLKKYPISVNQNTPVITLSQSDVNIYNNYQTLDGSDVVVVPGEKISEYQMLEAMLLPSADNMADSLAIWAFGSLSNYAAYANTFLTSQGIDSTHVGSDASGFDPSTVSTASDLVKLGELAVANPVIKQIVGTKSAIIPVAGTILNVNSLLGESNINGIKTGNTTQAGGVYLSSSVVSVNNQPVTIYTAVMGAPALWEALNDSFKLITVAQANFVTPTSLNVIKSGAVIGYYSVPWSNRSIEALSSSNLPLVIWRGDKVHVFVTLNKVSDKSKAKTLVGLTGALDTNFNVKQVTNVYLSSSVPQPSRWWLLTHPNVSIF